MKTRTSRLCLTFSVLFTMAAICTAAFGCVRLWRQSQKEPGQIFCFSGKLVSAIEFEDPATGKQVVIQDDEALKWVINDLNQYRYSYASASPTDEERQKSRIIRIHNGWRWESYLISSEGFLIDGVWYGGDRITMSSLCGYVD